jgi:hypothetical protein
MISFTKLTYKIKEIRGVLFALTNQVHKFDGDTETFLNAILKEVQNIPSGLLSKSLICLAGLQKTFDGSTENIVLEIATKISKNEYESVSEVFVDTVFQSLVSIGGMNFTTEKIEKRIEADRETIDEAIKQIL